VKKIIIGGIALLAPVLIGCSTHPLPDDVSRVSTYDIVQSARCEAKRAVLDHGQGINAAIAYEFTFDINELNHASGMVTFTQPFLTGGQFTLGAGAGVEGERNAHRNFRVVDMFSDLRALDCSPEMLQKNWVYPMTGDIGVYEVVSTFARLQSIAHLENPVGEMFVFGDTLTFTTTFMGSLTPSVALNAVTDKFLLTAASADLHGHRTDMHEVILGLSPTQQTTRSRTRGTMLARTGFAVAAPLAASTTLLSTTLLQDAAEARGRALLELDRQRILRLQARAQNLLVGP
jgi:hypothetical protein